VVFTANDLFKLQIEPKSDRNLRINIKADAWCFFACVFQTFKQAIGAMGHTVMVRFSRISVLFRRSSSF
jgi:hypothetical protein